MGINLDDVDLGVVVNIEILREVLHKMSVNGRRWWIACEPEYALQRGYVSLGYGDPGCVDRLNTVYYRVPLLSTQRPLGGSDKLLVLLDASVIVPEQAGLYRDGGQVVQDEIADIEEFFIPIRRALVPVLATYCGASWAGTVATAEAS